jgi:hypothetical protein
VYFIRSCVNVRYFGEVKYHILNIGVKSVNEWIIHEGKVYFPKKKSI